MAVAFAVGFFFIMEPVAITLPVDAILSVTTKL